MKKKLLIPFAISCLLLSACGDNTPPPEKGPDDSSPNDTTSHVVQIHEDDYEWYFDMYLSAWDLITPFQNDYNESTFATVSKDGYILYAGSIFQEGMWPDYVGVYGDIGIIPADFVESVVTRHFPISAKQYQAALPQSDDAYNFYNAIDNVYDFPGGLGGEGMVGKIYNATIAENVLKLSCEWFDMNNVLVFSHQVTIILGETSLDFYYRENVVTYDSPNR
jgi:hypothetical protein